MKDLKKASTAELEKEVERRKFEDSQKREKHRKEKQRKGYKPLGIKVRILSWDWKEQVDTNELNTALAKVFDGKNCPYIVEVDTQSDSAGIVIAPKKITNKAAQIAWEKYEDEDADEFPEEVEI